MKRFLQSAAMIVAMVATPLPAQAAEKDGGTAAPHPVILINVFQVPEGRLDDAVAYWESARDFLQDRPGYLSTALHRSLLPDARYQLINVARWESVEAFRLAIAAMQSEADLEPVDGLKFDAALYEVIRSD